MASLVFSAASVEIEERPSRQPVPNGNYVALITDSEIKTTKRGDGRYLQLVWEITKGEHKGRMIWDRLNVENPNPTAVKIAQQDLAAICTAMGKGGIDDSDELHYKEITIAVQVSPASNGHDASNEIKGYSAPAGAAPVAPAAPAPAAQEAFVDDIPGGAPAKPWEK
tara:strand:- start:716 stop:1216 length:501 start_codon:yes stop_codon:yes gene_type:complete